MYTCTVPTPVQYLPLFDGLLEIKFFSSVQPATTKNLSITRITRTSKIKHGNPALLLTMPALLALFSLLLLPAVVCPAFTNCTPTSPLIMVPATPLELANLLVGTGVSIVNESVLFYGNEGSSASQIAKFLGGATIFGNIDDMDSGLVLTTGNVNAPMCRPQNPVSNSLGIDSYRWPLATQNPIDQNLVQTCRDFYNDNGLSANIANCGRYFDQALLSFNFTIKAKTTMGIKYVFASEEWPSFVRDLYSDGFAFYIDGVNIALTPNTTTARPQGVAVGSINCRIGPSVAITNPLYCHHCCLNCDLYIDNGGGQYSSQCLGSSNEAKTYANLNKFTYNGYTKVLEGIKVLEAGEHSIKMVIADMLDQDYDSAVFIAAKSLVAPNPICYSVTQVGHCAVGAGFQETFVTPLSVFPSGHPVLSRSDCDGAPGSALIPGEGKALGGNCVDKVDGGTLYYSYDSVTRSDRTGVSQDATALMYVVRDTYRRAYLVVSLGKPVLAAGFTEASTKMVFRLVNVTGDPYPIVKDDPTGDAYSWNADIHRGSFRWTWGSDETDGVVLGPFVEGNGWCVEWDMEELSPPNLFDKYLFGSYVDGVFETNVEITEDMFDAGGGNGVRLCGCAGLINDVGAQSCGSCRIAEECGDLGGTGTTGGSGSGSGASTTTTTTTTGASSGLGIHQDRGGQGGGGTGATNNGTGTGSSGSSGTKKDDVVEKDPGPVGLENPAVIAAIVVTCLVLCCCISIGILTIPHKTKSMFGKRRTTLAKARASLDVTRGAKRERPGMATLAQREILAAKMEGSQWWYIDLDAEEQGPYSTPGEWQDVAVCVVDTSNCCTVVCVVH